MAIVALGNLYATNSFYDESSSFQLQTARDNPGMNQSRISSKSNSTLLVALVIMALAVVLAFAPARTNAADTATALVSDPVYKKDCAKCHGGNAGGRHFRGPALNSDKARAMSADETAQIVSAGHGRMPSFANKLTSQQITALAAEIKTFQANGAAK